MLKFDPKLRIVSISAGYDVVELSMAGFMRGFLIFYSFQFLSKFWNSLEGKEIGLGRFPKIKNHESQRTDSQKRTSSWIYSPKRNDSQWRIDSFPTLDSRKRIDSQWIIDSLCLLLSPLMQLSNHCHTTCTKLIPGNRESILWWDPGTRLSCEGLCLPLMAAIQIVGRHCSFRSSIHPMLNSMLNSTHWPITERYAN